MRKRKSLKKAFKTGVRKGKRAAYKKHRKKMMSRLTPMRQRLGRRR